MLALVARGFLDSTSINNILHSMFPRDAVSGETVCAVLSYLPRLASLHQVWLLKWLLLVDAHLDASGRVALRQLYGMFFRLLDFEYLRYWACRILYLVSLCALDAERCRSTALTLAQNTARGHILPFRVRKLMALLRRMVRRVARMLTLH